MKFWIQNDTVAVGEKSDVVQGNMLRPINRKLSSINCIQKFSALNFIFITSILHAHRLTHTSIHWILMSSSYVILISQDKFLPFSCISCALLDKTFIFYGCQEIINLKF